MVDRWPTLDPIPPVEPEPQKNPQEIFAPDKEFQGPLEVVTVTRGRYGEIKRESRLVREPKLRYRTKT